MLSLSLNQWENISSDLSPNHLVKIENKLYASSLGGIFVYDLENNDFDLNNHNYCLEVSAIKADENNELWVLCQNGLIYKNNSNLIVNHLNIDKAYDFVVSDESIYMIYENDDTYGLIELLLDSNEITYRDYYEGFTNNNSEIFKTTIIFNETIYLLTNTGIYYANINDDLKFSNNWSMFSDIEVPLDIASFNDKLIFVYSDSINVFEINNENNFVNIESVAFELGEFIDLSINEKMLILGTERIISIDDNLNVIGEYIDDFSQASCIFSSLDDIYLGVIDQGFWHIDDNIQKCAPNTLLSSDIEALYYNDHKLYGINRDGVFIYNQANFSNLLSLIDENSFLDASYTDQCNMFNGFQLNYIPGTKISSSIISYNDKIFLPNSGIVPDESQNKGGFIIIDEADFEIEGIIGESELEGLNGIYDDNTNNYLTINQIKKDDLNRIWVVNPYAEKTNNILAYFNPIDNTWGHVEAPNNQSYLPQEIAFDNNGRIWVAFRNETKLISSETYSDGGIKIAMPDGSWYLVENLESLPGEDSNVSVWSLGFSDFQGNEILWVLTSNGVQGYSISPSYNGDFFNDNPYDDYLFRIDRIYPLDFFTNITFSKGDKIKVDPQNNIWITTAHSGIYVIKNSIDFWPNSDGINTENSDILSNVVRDVAFDSQNGVAFIATDKGLSMLGIPFEENKKNSNIGVSPNPFIVGEDSHILIDDIYSGSIIKIMTLSGRVLKELQLPYNENRISWNGKDKEGRMLETGVYLIVVQNDEYGNGVTKLAIIK